MQQSLTRAAAARSLVTSHQSCHQCHGRVPPANEPAAGEPPRAMAAAEKALRVSADQPSDASRRVERGARVRVGAFATAAAPN